MRKRALIVTDSLGAPRYEPETINYEQTWVYGVKDYLEKNGYDVFAITHNGLHSLELLSLTETKLNLYSAQIIILQYGLVDCAPRALKDKEILLFRILRLGKIAHYFAKKYHAQISKIRKISLFPLDVFECHVKKIYNLLKRNNAKIVQIPIAPACLSYKNISPQIEANISLYNEILKKNSDIYLSEFSDCSEGDAESLFMDDHHHLNRSGHAVLKDLVIKSLGLTI